MTLCLHLHLRNGQR